MDTIDILKDILANVNRRKPRSPSIDELPPEGRDVNWNPSGEGSATTYTGKMEKTRTRRRFSLGQRVRFFLPRDGVFEEGVVVFRRGSDKYQVRSEFSGRNHLVSGRGLKPL